ncbi:MAG: hypothetical protein M3380_01455 [Chloroflexota bacterium]|nr:hypothetical protein [Chloroflexota bacterium]
MAHVWKLLALLLCGCGDAVTVEMAAGAEAAAPPVATASPEADPICPLTTPVQDEPLRDPNADPFGFGNWYVNADRTLWADAPADGGWRAGGEKVAWIRPAGTQLMVTGRRLDGESPPLKAGIPSGYHPGFQISGLTFPTAGCWEVTAKAGEHELQFVTAVVPSDAPVVRDMLRLGRCG